MPRMREHRTAERDDGPPTLGAVIRVLEDVARELEERIGGRDELVPIGWHMALDINVESNRDIQMVLRAHVDEPDAPRHLDA